MGTTTKMAIPYPEATGLVKDGWEDMKDIATQVDAKSGLILLSATTFSAVSSASVNSVFSTTYKYYKILFDLTSSVSDVSIYFRLRASGSDQTTGYYGGRVVVNTAGGGGYSSSNNAAFYYLVQSDANKSFVQMDLSATSEARWTHSGYQGYTNGSQTGAGGLEATYTADGFTIYPASGNITGSVHVYGFNQ